MDCTYQALDVAQRLALFEVTGVDAVGTHEVSDGRGGRLRTQSLLGLATRVRRVDDDRVRVLSVGVGGVGVGPGTEGVARAASGGTATGGATIGGVTVSGPSAWRRGAARAWTT